jgi:transposase
MPAPISMDLRRRIVRAVEGGSSSRGAARRFAVSPSTAIKLMQRVRATGSPAPARYGGHRRPVLEPHETDLRWLVEATPDITLAELQSELQRRLGVRAGLSTIHNALRRIGLRHKKSPGDRPNGTAPTSPASAGCGAAGRASWTRRGSSSSTTPTNRARRYGRSPPDRRLVATVPHGHWRTTTFIAGLRQTGVIAPLVLDGPITGVAFRASVEQFLAPALAPGDVVVLDHPAAHKVDGVRQAIAAAGGSILDLPPYSPDLNPIEQLFAKLKALLRKAAARTRDELWSTIGHLLATVPAGECANYLSHCGYGST